MNRDSASAQTTAPVSRLRVDEASASSVSISRRVAVIGEVTLAFVLVRVAFRSTKNFTSVGRLDESSRLNFTPGIVMVLFTLGVLLVRRRETFHLWNFVGAVDGEREVRVVVGRGARRRCRFVAAGRGPVRSGQRSRHG